MRKGRSGLLSRALTRDWNKGFVVCYGRGFHHMGERRVCAAFWLKFAEKKDLEHKPSQTAQLETRLAGVLILNPSPERIET